MDASARSEVASIRAELQSIINELYDIAAGVRADFRGIGTEHCAKGILRVADQYNWVKRQLDSIG